MAEGNSAKNELLNTILRKQLELLKVELDSYLSGDPLGRGDQLMPHQWGSLDSFDDMRNATSTAHSLLDAMQDAMLGEPPEQILERIREAFDEIFFPCSTDDQIRSLLGLPAEDDE